MRRIIRIAVNDLRQLFYSPVAWAVLLVFVFHMGFSFVNTLWGLFVTQHTQHFTEANTRDLYSTGLFGLVRSYLYLYIPFLSMGIMSREYGAGSIKLLFSSPVTVFEVILSKYLSLVVFLGGMLGLLGVFVAPAACFTQSPDWGLIASGYLGIVLLGMGYCAVGLFVSSTTEYQVVAALVTLVIFTAMDHLGNVGQGIPVIGDITWFLSIQNRIDNLLKGLVVSGDLVYFATIISLFVGCSMWCLRCRIQGKRFVQSLYVYAGLFAVAICLGIWSGMPQRLHYLDLTRDELNTVSFEDRALLQSMDKPLTVTDYVNVLGDLAELGWPSERNNEKLYFAPYQRFLKYPIRYEHVYYYGEARLVKTQRPDTLREMAMKVADAVGLDRSLIKSPSEVKGLDFLDGYFGRKLEYGGVSTWLRLLTKEDEYMPKEAEVMAALKNLTQGPASVSVLKVHHERSLDNDDVDGLSLIMNEPRRRGSLVSNGFVVREATDTFPKNGCLVIAGPRSSFAPDELRRIGDYIADGGNLLIASEPGSQDVVNPLLATLGMHQAVGMLHQHETTLCMGEVRAPAGMYKSPFWTPYDKDSAVGFPGVAPLLMDSSKGFNIIPIVTVSSSDSAYTVAAALTRTLHGREQRILVTGDVDWMCNGQTKEYNYHNVEWFMRLFNWLDEGQYPIDTYRRPGKDTVVLAKQSWFLFLKLLFLVAAPCMVLAAGGLILLRRASK